MYRGGMKRTTVLVICAIVLVAAIVLMLTTSIDHFQTSPSETLEIDGLPVQKVEVKTPLSIYYTDKVDQCDTPGAFYIADIRDDAYKIDYSFDVTWYKKLYGNVVAAIGGYNPTPQMNLILMQLQEVIDQYSKFPFGPSSCKVTVPRWGNIMLKRDDVNTDENIILGDISQNKARGPPSTWAFIGHPSPNIPLLQNEEGITFSTDGESNHFRIKSATDDQEYVRATLSNFGPNVARTLFCSESSEMSDSFITFGIKVDPNTGRAVFIKNNREADVRDITDLDIIMFFAPFFREERIDLTPQSEKLVKLPSTRMFTVMRLTKDPCGVVRKSMTPAQLFVTFNDVATLKNIANNVSDGRYLKGNSEKMKMTNENLDGTIAKAKEDMDTAYGVYVKARSDEEVTRRTKDDAVQQYNSIYNTLRSILMFRSAKWWAFSNRSRERINQAVAHWEGRRSDKALEIRNYNLAVDQKRAILQSTYSAYIEKYNDFRYYTDIKSKIHGYIDFMNDELIRDIRTMLVTNRMQLYTTSPRRVGEVTIPDVYWRYLSHDGNLYIVL